MVDTTQNQLYPVFLRLDRLRLLIVGAGEVGYEKLSFLLKSSPNARVTVVAPEVNPDVAELIAAAEEAEIELRRRPFEAADIEGHDLVIAATNITDLNREVHRLAKAAGKVVNVADTPSLCDFYLGSIVTRGPLKIAVSTNGQSPTFAKRLRQWLEAELPEDIPTLLERLRTYRSTLRGDFAEKVRRLNELTASLLPAEKEEVTK